MMEHIIGYSSIFLNRIRKNHNLYFILDFNNCVRKCIMFNVLNHMDSYRTLSENEGI